MVDYYDIALFYSFFLVSVILNKAVDELMWRSSRLMLNQDIDRLHLAERGAWKGLKFPFYGAFTFIKGILLKYKEIS